MFKRVLLAFTFIAVVGVASLGVGSSALAWNDCGTPGYVAAYPSPYYASYGAGWAPQAAYYPAPVPVRAYPVYYGRGYDYHRHDHHHSGLTVSFGF